MHLGLLSSASEIGRHAFWAAGGFRLEARTHVLALASRTSELVVKCTGRSLSAQEWIDKKLCSTDLSHDAENLY